jgi:hypothetical protein
MIIVAYGLHILRRTELGHRNWSQDNYWARWDRRKRFVVV